MIGDQIPTDIFFGKNCGMSTLLTMTGVTDPEILRRSKIQPDWVINSFEELLRDHS